MRNNGESPPSSSRHPPRPNSNNRNSTHSHQYYGSSGQTRQTYRSKKHSFLEMLNFKSIIIMYGWTGK